jgi:hypothetical protein
VNSSEIKKHLLPVLIVFVLISVIWIINQVPFLSFVQLALGLLIGAFFLDIDHIIYWLYINPNTEESRLAQIALKKRDFDSIIKLIWSTQRDHINLIFHHFFFQVVLVLISVFVFTSTSNTLAMAFLISLNIHLLVDQYEDYQQNPTHLQQWLFARESKQLPITYLGHYLGVFVILTLLLLLLLINSAL